MLWNSLEAPWQGTSNDYPEHMFSCRNKKIIETILTLPYPHPPPHALPLPRDMVSLFKKIVSFFAAKHVMAFYIEAILMSTHTMFCTKKKNKKKKNNEIIFSSMIVKYSSVEMTGNYSPNIHQNIVELKLGTRGKNSAEDILFFFS